MKLAARRLGLLFLAATWASCGGVPCSTTAEYFSHRAWGQVFRSDCALCHKSGGTAYDSGLILLNESAPEFVETNLDSLRTVARREYKGTSILLLKPTGQIGHDGGKRFDRGSERYLVLEALVTRFADPASCAQGSSPVAE